MRTIITVGCGRLHPEAAGDPVRIAVTTPGTPETFCPTSGEVNPGPWIAPMVVPVEVGAGEGGAGEAAAIAAGARAVTSARARGGVRRVRRMVANFSLANYIEMNTRRTHHLTLGRVRRARADPAGRRRPARERR